MNSMIERVAQALQQEMGTASFDEPPSSFALTAAIANIVHHGPFAQHSLSCKERTEFADVDFVVITIVGVRAIMIVIVVVADETTINAPLLPFLQRQFHVAIKDQFFPCFEYPIGQQALSALGVVTLLCQFAAEPSWIDLLELHETAKVSTNIYR